MSVDAGVDADGILVSSSACLLLASLVDMLLNLLLLPFVVVFAPGTLLLPVGGEEPTRTTAFRVRPSISKTPVDVNVVDAKTLSSGGTFFGVEEPGKAERKSWLAEMEPNVTPETWNEGRIIVRYATKRQPVEICTWYISMETP